MAADELELLVKHGLITAGQADSARQVDDAIAATAIGKLVCIGSAAKDLLPGYAMAFGLAAAADEVLKRSVRPELPSSVLDELAALLAAPTWGSDGMMEIVVASADTAARLVELPLPPHRVLLADEPRLMGLLDRVLGADAAAPAPPAVEPPLQTAAVPAKPERWLARPVREIDRREKRDPNASVPVPVASPPESSGPNAVARREPPVPPAPLGKPEPRGLPKAAIAFAVLAVVGLGVAGVVIARAREPAPVVVVDLRAPALEEGRAKERAGDFAWAIAAYSKAADAPVRDDVTAQALLGRARSNVALGDREAALRDIALVIDGAFASPALKADAEALRTSLR